MICRWSFEVDVERSDHFVNIFYRYSGWSLRNIKTNFHLGHLCHSLYFNQKPNSKTHRRIIHHNHFPKAQQPLDVQDLIIVEASLSHSDTPHSVGLLWTSDQPDAQTSTRQHTTLTRDIHAPGGIRTHNSSKRASAFRRFRHSSNVFC